MAHQDACIALQKVDCEPWRRFLARPGRFAIFGTSTCGLSVRRVLGAFGVRPVAFLDNQSQGMVDEVESFHPAQIRDLELDAVLIGSMYGMEMYTQLRAYGYQGPVLDFSVFHLSRWTEHFSGSLINDARDDIDAARRLFSDTASRAIFDSILSYRQTLLSGKVPAPSRQYRHPCLDFRSGQTIIDGGAFDGKDSLDWAAKIGPHGCVHAFEPVASTFTSLQKKLNSSPLGRRVMAWKLALWNKEEQLKIATEETSADQFRVHAQGHEIIDAVRIDDFVERQELSGLDFLKMDIEGAEKQALEGAKNSLCRFHPQLAISCYHLPADLWEIPLLIARLMPGCEIFLGHHAQNLFDTVCYAHHCG